MLWETVDPLEQLERRFGFRGAADASDWVADVLDRHWGLTVTHCERLVISSWNVMAWIVAGDRRLVAKWSALPPRFARLQDTANVVAWLDGSGIPVAAPIPARDGRLLVELANLARGRVRSRLPLPGSRFLLGVLPVVQGDLLDIGDEAQVVDAGRMLAALHEALAACPHTVGRRNRKPGEQLVHNDFRSANVLHDGTKVTAVLDLEELGYGARIADVARAAVLLGTRYRNWRPAAKEVRDRFIGAYDQATRTRLTPDEWAAFDELVASNLHEKWWSAQD